ncbi:MAG: metal-dependent hydrolase [Nanoarchaeota archaeon]
MALAVTHVIITIIVLDVFRHYVFGKKKFPRYLLVVGGIAGLLPDIDVPLTWIYNLLMGTTGSLHGLFTHSILFPAIFLILTSVFFLQKKIKLAKISLVIFVGLFLHLLLDCLYGGYSTFLWPMEISTAFCPQWGIKSYASAIDALILVAWLIHEEAHKLIKDYF